MTCPARPLRVPGSPLRTFFTAPHGTRPEGASYDELIVALNGVYDKPRYLLFDEIQSLPRWGLFVDRLQRQGYRLVVTGSNANLLSSELATHLTGRHMASVLLPFSFGEFLSATGAGLLTDMEKAGALDMYAEQGGYPEPLLKKVDRRDYLRTLLQPTLYQDIVKRFKVREQVGQNKKIYCIDNGMALATGVRFSPDRGALFENLVAVSLKKRELRALVKASAMLECRELFLQNDRIDRAETFRWHDLEREVRLIPVWKWSIENR